MNIALLHGSLGASSGNPGASVQEYQYKYFKDLYDEENRRTAELHDNAKINTTIVSLYAAFVGLAGTRSPPEFGAGILSPHAVPGELFILSLICLFVSIMISLYTTRIREYQVQNFPREVFNSISSDMSQSQFYEDRVIDLVAASEYNSNINDEKVDYLAYARALLLVGVAAHFCYHATVLFKL